MACTEEEFREQLSAETFIDLAKLQDMSRYGIPDGVRGEVWPYLLGVLKPLNTQQDTRRLSSYQVYLNMEQDKQSTADISKRVRYSVERYCAGSPNPWLQRPETRKALENVQIAFMNANAEMPYLREMTCMLAPILWAVQKEDLTFLCFEALVHKIGTALPVQKIPHKVGQLMMLIRSILPQLSGHLEEEGIQPNDWAQSWLQFLLSRELPLPSVLRLWDTYFSAPQSLQLHLYVCLAILSHLSEELTQLTDAELRGALQRLPLMDIDRIISEAYNLEAETGML
jgi:hypothetical protein